MDEERRSSSAVGPGAAAAGGRTKFDQRRRSEHEVLPASAGPGAVDAVWCPDCAEFRRRGVLVDTVHVPACVVAQHREAGSCYITAGSCVYDVTPFLLAHPGGEKSILQKAQRNEDCAMDLTFHSKGGQKLWKKYRIGQLVECGKVPAGAGCALM